MNLLHYMFALLFMMGFGIGQEAGVTLLGILLLLLLPGPDLVPRMDSEDSVTWSLNANGCYSTRSAWSALRSVAPEVGWYNMVWYKKSVPCWSFIQGIALLSRLSTKDRLVAWGVLIDKGRVLCNGGQESHLHMLFT